MGITLWSCQELSVQPAVWVVEQWSCLDPFTLIMEAELCRKLAGQGISLQGGPVVAAQSKWNHLDYLNLWAPPIGESAQPEETLFCNLCHRHRGRRASSILASSIPSDPGRMHLWKLRDSSSFFVVSDLLMAQLTTIKDFNARFEELRVVAKYPPLFVLFFTTRSLASRRDSSPDVFSEVPLHAISGWVRRRDMEQWLNGKWKWRGEF